MVQPLPLSGAPAPGFDEPFGMLEACHERLQRTLALLQKLRAHLRQHGADAQARQAAADVMRYFDQAAPRHHEDEELHVFPPLLAAGDPPTVAVVQRLQQEHRAMETQWAAARQVLAAIAQGEAALAPAGEAALDAFARLYGGHIEAEEQIAYPAAQTALDAGARQAMGQDMARRRGVAP